MTPEELALAVVGKHPRDGSRTEPLQVPTPAADNRIGLHGAMHLIYSAPVHVNLRLVDAMGAASGTQSEGRTRMRKLICLAAVAALALTLGAGSASAQTVVYDYDDHNMWWDAHDCDAMKRLLPIMTGGARNSDETTAEHTARVCVGSDKLMPEDTIIIRTFIQATPNGPFKDNKAWWDHADQTAAFRQALAGRTAIQDASGLYAAPTALTTSPATDYDDTYDNLRSRAKTVVDKVGMYLSGRGMMMTDGDDDDDTDEAPALPLVGVGILGLLLAGRGAWLRRRA